jgi:hypothetical protein
MDKPYYYAAAGIILGTTAHGVITAASDGRIFMGAILCLVSAFVIKVNG